DVELGAGVMMVEEELLAEELVEAADEEEQIRRVAAVNDVKAARGKHAQRQHKRPQERRAVFDEVAERAGAFGRELVAPDMDAVDRLDARLAAAAGGADDRH